MQEDKTQLLEGDVHADGAEADAFGGLADTEQAHAATPNEALLSECFQRIVPSVVLGNHPQAGGPAVHRVKLMIIGERMGHGNAVNKVGDSLFKD